MKPIFGKVLFLLFLISFTGSFLFISPVLNAQESVGPLESGRDIAELELPSWLLVEYGKLAMEMGEYGIALRYFREAVFKERVLPEAELLIGDIFSEEGNFELAEKQYEKALEQANQLYIIEERSDILYKLAGLYKITGDSDKYRSTLLRITKADDTFQNSLNSNLRNRYLSILAEDGFDKLITLYRLDSRGALLAHSLLGEIYFEEGNYELSTLHYLFAVVTVFTKSIEELQFHDPDFSYETARDFFRRCSRFSLITDYFTDSMLFSNLLSFAEALAAYMPERGARSAAEIIRLVSNAADSDRVRRRAASLLSGL